MQNLHERLFAIAEWALIVLAALLPVFVIPVDWIVPAQSKGFLACAVFIVAVVVWVAGSVAEGSLRVPKNWFLAAAALLPIAYITSAILSGASWSSYVGNGTSIDTVAATVLFYILFLIVASLFVRKGILRPLSALLIGGSVLTLFSAARLLVPSDLFNMGGALAGTATSAIGSWHDLGIFLVFFVFVILVSSHTIVKKRLYRFVLYALALIAGLFLVVNNFSDVWYSAAVLFGVYAILKVFVLKKEGMLWSGIARGVGIYIAIAIVAFAFGYGGAWVQERLPEKLQVVHIEVRPSWQGTLEVGERALSGRELFFGTGPNTFTRDWSLYKPISVNTTEFWSVDFGSGVGAVPTSVVTVGLFGALAWGLVILLLLIVAYRRVAQNDTLGIALAASALFLTAFQVLYTPGFALSLLAFLVYGLVIAHAASRESAWWQIPIGLSSWRESTALIVFVGLVLGSIGLGVQTARRLISDTLVNRSIQAYAKEGDRESVARYTAKANVWYPNNDRARRAAVELGLLELQALVAQGVETEEEQRVLQNVLARTIEHGLSATVSESKNYQNWLVLARLYSELAGSQIEGAEGNAREAYNEARRTNPTSPLPIMGLAQLELALGNVDVARELLEQALVLKPNFVAAHFLLSQIEAGRGNFENARDRAAVVVELAPEDSLAWYNLGAILYTMRSFPAAALALERAVALNSNYANALFVLALSYYEMDREEEALAKLEQLQILDPSSTIPPRAIENINRGLPPLSP